MKSFFGTLFKVLFALGAVFAATSAIVYLMENKKSDYIEIFDDEDDYSF